MKCASCSDRRERSGALYSLGGDQRVDVRRPQELNERLGSGAILDERSDRDVELSISALLGRIPAILTSGAAAMMVVIGAMAISTSPAATAVPAMPPASGLSFERTDARISSRSSSWIKRRPLVPSEL